MVYISRGWEGKDDWRRMRGGREGKGRGGGGGEGDGDGQGKRGRERTWTYGRDGGMRGLRLRGGGG